jgi:hypothetical protein
MRMEGMICVLIPVGADEDILRTEKGETHSNWKQE